MNSDDTDGARVVGAETFAIDSPKGTRFLTLRYLDINDKGPSSESLRVIANTLKAVAMQQGRTHEVAVRVAGSVDSWLLATYDKQNPFIRIGHGGWRFVDQVGGDVRFTLPTGCLPLPVPSEESDCSLEGDYLDLFNLESFEQRQLLVVSAVQKLDPIGPYVIDNFAGEQGSAKSTATRMHRCLIDPNSTPLRRRPKDEQDLMIAAQNSRIVTLENMSEIPSWLSDAICMLATGGGLSTRQLYTTAGEHLFNAKRPVIVNGIPALTDRGDFADRSLLFRLSAIPDHERKTEREIQEKWQRSHPRALRALLDLAARVQQLRVEGAVKMPSHPRMADFAELGVAVEIASQEGVGGLAPWPDGSFMAAYGANRLETQGMTLESGFGGLLIDLLEKRLLSQDDAHLGGTPSEAWQVELRDLLRLCQERVENNAHLRKIIPNNERWLRTGLTRLAPALRANGVAVRFGHHPTTRRSMVLFSGHYGGEPIQTGDDDGVEF